MVARSTVQAVPGVTRSSGASLVQLATALAIAAVLVLAALPAYRGSRLKAYLAEARQFAREWAHTALAYYIRTGSWNGAGDQAIGWTRTETRYWTLGPHRYGPQGAPDEAWFVATLKPGLLAGTHSYAQQTQDPDYAYVINVSARNTRECGQLLGKPCGSQPGGGPPDSGDDNPQELMVTTLWQEPYWYDQITVRWQPVSGATAYRVTVLQGPAGMITPVGFECQDTTASECTFSYPEAQIVWVRVDPRDQNGSYHVTGPVLRVIGGGYYAHYEHWNNDQLVAGWVARFDPPYSQTTQMLVRYREVSETDWTVETAGHQPYWNFSSTEHVLSSATPDRCYEYQIRVDGVAYDGRQVTTGWIPEVPRVAGCILIVRKGQRSPS